jgi:hypothetical protein
MQVDWKEIERIKLSMFVATLGYSRMMYAEFTISQDQEHVLQCLINRYSANLTLHFQVLGLVHLLLCAYYQTAPSEEHRRNMKRWRGG